MSWYSVFFYKLFLTLLRILSSKLLFSERKYDIKFLIMFLINFERVLNIYLNLLKRTIYLVRYNFANNKFI